MDAKRFDHMAVSLGTRRGVLQALGLALAGSAAFLRQEATEAKRHHHGKRKDQRQRRRRRQDARSQAACATLLSQAGCTQSAEGSVTVWTCAAQTNLQSADLQGCNLIGAHLDGVNLNGAILNNAILNNAHLEGAHLVGASLYNVTMVEARAAGVNLSGGVDLRLSDLRKAIFTDGSLNHADLEGAEMVGAVFQNTDLRDILWASKGYSATICPDHASFRAVGGDCCGHLNGWTTPNCSGRTH